MFQYSFILLFSFIVFPLLPTYNGVGSNISFAEFNESYDCDVLFDGVDPSTGKERKVLQRKFLLGFTHPKIREARKGKDFMKIDASLSRVSGYNLINLYITIDSKQAQSTYGSIAEGDFLMIKLINGDKLHAYNTNTDYGAMNPYKSNTVYQVSYTLKENELKDLEKLEVDKIGIMWTTGFEEYEVFNVDFFIKQAACLKS